MRIVRQRDPRTATEYAPQANRCFGYRRSRGSEFGFRTASLVRHTFFAVTVLLLCPGNAWSQTSTNALTALNSAPPDGPPPQTENEEAKHWSYSTSVYGYIVPNDQSYAQPTVTADRDWLHLEARYNYEAHKTGSAWLGYNFGGGKTLEWEVTPMLGAVFGNTTGIAPGYKGALRWWKLELYSEGEYVVDSRDSSGNFFYNWSELTLAPVDWFRFGVVTQRTRTYDTDREIQRGLLAGVSYKMVNFTTYVFNPDDSRPIVVLAFGLTF